ncbi:MAG: response regulator [Proteobacteria bacterium]|nr:response regulator [Pseudomonadota bacterium]MBU4295229.1 response regulator [Pseudomonadota bacterium]MCG2750163.1 response regulator [Desulfobulbaceae bacterium]
MATAQAGNPSAEPSVPQAAVADYTGEGYRGTVPLTPAEQQWLAAHSLITLAVVHGIVKSRHGHISVYSELGKGTTFHVYLPCVAMETYAAEAENKGSVPMGHERILMVDDEEQVISILRQILEGLGYTVTALTGSIATWQAFSSHPQDYDLVITDMTMPDMTGTELALKILRLRPDMPIVLCTGFNEQISEEKAKSLGIRAYITKPVLRNDFAVVVRRTLDEA